MSDTSNLITLADILEALCENRPDGVSLPITGAVVDSRQAFPGCLFVALQGERADGHDYIGDAFQRGAVLALVQRQASQEFPLVDLRRGLPPQAIPAGQSPLCLQVTDSLQALQQIARFWRRKCDVRITGITGSVGKSTTKEVAAEVLSRRYSTLKNTGNLNNEIGLPLTILGLRRDHQRAVLEMGFYVPGEIKFLCDIALPHVGMLTNIGTVHAERAGSQAEIARGKAELVEALPPEGVAILNYDDPLVRPMAQQTQAKVLFYGLTAEADLWADEVQGMGLDGIRFRLHYAKETFHLRVPMIGRHSVHTALRAAALGLVEGLSWQEIFEGLRFSQTQLRLVSVFAPNGALLLDDTYNASPQSTLAAINLLDELEGRKIAVLGDMLELGPYERQGHEMVGIRAAAVADELVTVGERARMISAAARNAGLPDTAITELQDTQAAIDFLRDRLQKDDIMLVKGSRGMHMDTIVPSLEAAK